MKKFLPWIAGGLLLVLFIICAAVFWLAYPLKYKSAIIKYSSQNNLEPSLVAAVICCESRFNKNAKSSAGACGLMQLMPATFDWVQEQLDQQNNDIFDPESNIASGCYYLQHLINKYINITFVLACYNAGEGVVATWGSPEGFDADKIKYSETKRYVTKVLSLQKLYKSRF